MLTVVTTGLLFAGFGKAPVHALGVFLLLTGLGWAALFGFLIHNPTTSVSAPRMTHVAMR